ncbi:VOC family protein [Mucilaginibacter sp. HMF5004]|uniref:VOC family protein n=1 Tax=Mucilaginibacter rivuli TaxID=2857527 RepID=UPI001C5D3216|nr:VOC family protein [Mucilaginibacter rivuli]MBW4889722.1 VOC family protein [Mucilaginibacter rivuli]
MMINYERIDHVYVCVPPGKEHEANQFYISVMGFEPKIRPADLDGSSGYWYQLPNMELHIGTELGPNNSKRHFAMQVTDLAAARQHLEKHGINIIEEVPIQGRDRFTFHDPYGNRMEFLAYH